MRVLARLGSSLSMSISSSLDINLGSAQAAGPVPTEGTVTSAHLTPWTVLYPQIATQRSWESYCLLSTLL